MQYILTEDEFQELQTKAAAVTKDARLILEDLCRRVANSEVIKVDRYGSVGHWGCVRDNAEYCDGCPVQEICTYQQKNWSQ